MVAETSEAEADHAGQRSALGRNGQAVPLRENLSALRGYAPAIDPEETLHRCPPRRSRQERHFWTTFDTVWSYAYVEVMTMTYKLLRICRSVVLSAFLVPTSLLAQGTMQGTSAPSLPSPDTRMSRHTGNIHSFNYPKFQEQGMSGMIGSLAVREMQDMPVIPYVTNPYSGMFGSMGNVYSPYYRQFHQSGMSGNAGSPGPGPFQGQGIRYHYPYFLPPTMGTR